MATTYKCIDATLNGNAYTVTVGVNKNATGQQLFTLQVDKPNTDALDVEFAAKVICWALASGTSLAAVKSVTYSIP